MTTNIINDNYIINIDEFPSRDELLNITEEIKINHCLQYLKKHIITAIINSEKNCTINFNDITVGIWILNKVLNLLKNKGYWINETNNDFTIYW